MPEWTVRGTHPGQGTIEETAESRAEAEEKKAEAESLGLGDVEIVPPGETDGGEPKQAEVVDTPGSDPRPAGTDFDSSIAIDSDPFDVLPGWMIDQVNHGNGKQPHLNKRGCQVIVEYLGLEVQTEPVIPAYETDFEYAYYRATVTKPDGREFVEHGAARVDGDDQTEEEAWGLDMQAETRAFKRGVKAATGGGLEAFAQERGGQ